LYIGFETSNISNHKYVHSLFPFVSIVIKDYFIEQGYNTAYPILKAWEEENMEDVVG